MSDMRAKFRVTDVQKFEGGERITFAAVGPATDYGADGLDENNTFARWTPSAEASIYIANPALFGQYQVGQEHYADFTLATPAPVAVPPPKFPNPLDASTWTPAQPGWALSQCERAAGSPPCAGALPAVRGRRRDSAPGCGTGSPR